MAFGRKILTVAGICFGVGMLYHSCQPEESSSAEREIISTNATQEKYKQNFSPYFNPSLSAGGKGSAEELEAEAQNQLAQLTNIQDILENFENLSIGAGQRGYVQAVFELYEYCQNAEENQALLQNEELLDKFRELFYRVPTYGGNLLYRMSSSPEEREYFSFNREEELDSADVSTFCKGGQCPDLDLESILFQVCGYAMDHIARRGKYLGQQSIEDFVFAQLLISKNEEEFKQLLTNRVIVDQKDIVEVLHGRVETREYFDLRERLQSLLPKTEELVLEIVEPEELLLEESPEEETAAASTEEEQSEINSGPDDSTDQEETGFTSATPVTIPYRR